MCAENAVRTCDQHPLVTVSVTGEAREDGGGLSGPQLVRLQLAYEGGTGPVQMVAKFGDWGDKQAMPAWPWQIRLIQVVGNLLEEQFRREILFYQDVHSHLQGLRLPRVYYVAMTDAPSVSAWSYVLFDTRTPLRFCLLLEDLAVDHFAAVPLGASLPFPKPNRRSSTSRSCMPSDGSSRVCGRSCTCGRRRGSPSYGRTRVSSGGSATNASGPMSSPPSCTAGPSPRIRLHARGVSMLQEPEGVAMLTALNASFATWAEDAAQTARLAPQTVVHGDFHGGNHLFHPHEACCVLDFQFVGTGARRR